MKNQVTNLKANTEPTNSTMTVTKKVIQIISVANNLTSAFYQSFLWQSYLRSKNTKNNH